MIPEYFIYNIHVLWYIAALESRQELQVFYAPGEKTMISYSPSTSSPELFTLTEARISASIKGETSQIDQWTAMKPHKVIVRSIGEAIALALFGAEMTEGNSELVHLVHEHTNNGKSFISYTLKGFPHS